MDMPDQLLFNQCFPTHVVREESARQRIMQDSATGRITMHAAQMGRQPDEATRCPRCNEAMTSIQPCHMFCCNCGAHLDCSDKGTYW